MIVHELGRMSKTRQTHSTIYSFIHYTYVMRLIFAGCSHKFLAEFLEVGGALTVVEILSVRQAREADKAEALRLLTCIAAAGRQYKELVCESYGTTKVIRKFITDYVMNYELILLLIVLASGTSFAEGECIECIFIQNYGKIRFSVDYV